MTMPDERTRSVQYAKEFLRSLLDPKQTPRVPRHIRREAARVLRHFPSTLDLEMASNKVPNVFGPPMYKLVVGGTLINDGKVKE